MEKVKQAIKKLYDLFIEKSDLIGYIVLGVFFIYLNLELYIRMEYLVESDMSSELVLARILAQEKKIFTTSWYYSTEIRILNYNLVFAPLFLLTDNWHIIRIVGIIILDLILFSSYYYLAKQYEL